MPFFSVIITVYNKEKYIFDTIKSVLNQDFSDFEVIIVNDGSKDASEKEIKKCTDKRIHYYSTPNNGASAARNFAVEKSNTDYLCFLDGDDLWETNHLEVLKKLLEEFPDCGIYASRYKLVFKNNKTLVPEFQGISNDFKGIIEDYFFSSMNHPVATSSSIMIPKKVFDTLGYFKTTISSGQDTDMWIRIALQYRIATSNVVTAKYIHHIEDSLSKTDILSKSILKFNDFINDEKTNQSLKKYLDKYRKEYALKYKMANENVKSRELFKHIDPKNIDFKYQLIYNLPTFILNFLLKTKQFLRSMGIDFNVYK